MGRVHDGIDDALREWISRQHIFFVATAPSGDGGHVNLSPKGTADTFTFLEPDEIGAGRPKGQDRCAYLDLTGSGAETIAHVRQNGRITLMWCAFEGPPRIVRFHGSASVVVPDDAGYRDLSARFAPRRGARAVIVVEIERVADSCGYSVPLMEFVGERTRLDEWAEARTDEELARYRFTKNATSIDGLPAL